MCLEVLGAALLQAIEDLDDDLSGQAAEADGAALGDGRFGAAPPLLPQLRFRSRGQSPAAVMGFAEPGCAAVTQPCAGQHAAGPESGQRPQIRTGQEFLDRDPEHGVLLVLVRGAQWSPPRFPRPLAAHSEKPDTDCVCLLAEDGQLITAAEGDASCAGSADAARASLDKAIAARHPANLPAKCRMIRRRREQHGVPVPSGRNEEIVVQQHIQPRPIAAGAVVSTRFDFSEKGHRASSPAA